MASRYFKKPREDKMGFTRGDREMYTIDGHDLDYRSSRSSARNEAEYNASQRRQLMIKKTPQKAKKVSTRGRNIV